MQTVKVRLRKPRRVLTFLCDNLHMDRDESCVVQTERGQEVGVCLLPPEPCSEEIGKKVSMRVLRKFSTRDEETFHYLAGEERKAREVCLDKIKMHKLPMKLVDVEYTFDKKKVIVYFTADDRVDFRELVRDLAHDLRSRIELRHIQVRDEAKMVGGLGSCGRQLCCTTWLNEFKPISMRMAKRQNLSLNPSKISGQCGRLLCCLSYENDMYEAQKPRSKPRRDEGASTLEAPKEKRDMWEGEKPAPRQPPSSTPPAKQETAQPQAAGMEASAPRQDAGEGGKKRRRGRRRRPIRKDGGGAGAAPTQN